MPIVLAKPPEGAEARIKEVLEALRSQPGFGPPELGRVTAAKMPHPVHFMGLAAVVEKQSPETAPLGAWRWLLDGDDQPLAAAQIRASERGLMPGVELNVGPFVTSTHEAIEAVREAPEVVKRDYELRLLRVPSLYVMALWLRPEIEGISLLVPMGPLPREIKLAATKPVTVDRFMRALAAPARAARERDNRPRWRRGGLLPPGGRFGPLGP